MVGIADRVELPDAELREFCRRWQIIELAAFGSVLRSDFHSASDLDVVAEFEPSARHSVFELVRMEEELAALVGRPVDLIERQAIEQNRNYLRRREILGTAKVFYHVG